MNPLSFTVTIQPAQIVVASLLALAVGAAYAWALNRPNLRWIAEDATDLSVIIGVAMTLLISVVLFFSAPVFFGMLWLFALTGLSQVVRSAYNRHTKRRDGRDGLKRAATMGERQ